MNFCIECHQLASDGASTCQVTGCGGTLRSEPLLGQIVDGRYQVEGVLGSGGVGMLLRARHTLLDAPVAIKVLDLRDADPEVAADMARRFRQEATLVAKLRHPAIVEISDFGISPDGRSYIVMELLEGRDLDLELCGGLPLSIERIEWVLSQVCDALAWVHDQGVVHRDIKPANIMICRLGGEECLKLLDFGVAKILEEGAAALSRANVVIGTPEYMAPEQIQPALGAIGPSTDIYALAVMVYEMLAGVTPFHQDSFLKICRHKLSCRYAPMAQRLPGMGFEPLDQVLRRALSRLPGQRQRSVIELERQLREAFGALDLSGFAAGDEASVTARPIISLASDGDEPVQAHQTTIERVVRLAGTVDAELCPSCGELLQAGVVACGLCGNSVEVSRDPLIGALLGGRYRIEQRLSREEFGVAYRAVDDEDQRIVELTALPPSTLADGEADELLRREVQRAAGLRHPGLVVVLDGGFDRALHLGYVVSQWLEGITLAEEYALCGVADPEVVRCRALETLEILEAVHQAGEVHGALQPSALIVTAHERGERLALVDLVRARWGNQMSVAVTLGRLGSPQFRPPEVLWDDQPMTPLSDVYGVGALLYFLVSGVPPYRSVPAEVLQRMSAGQLEPPSEVAKGLVDPELEAIVLKAMCRQPRERYGSAREMAAAIEAAR